MSPETASGIRFAAMVSGMIFCLAAAAQEAPPGPGRGRGGGFGSGPNDKQVVDSAAADRGRTVYAAQCVDCHGVKARGADGGPDLVRSVIVLHDRLGSELGPFLHRGHRLQSGASGATLSEAQVLDLSHFLKQRFNDTLRSGPYNQPINVLTGDPKAGATFFRAAGQCTGCHSATGDLAHVGSKYDPVSLQQKFLFPKPVGGRGPGGPYKPTTITVTAAGEAPVSGVLVRIDDFNVSLRDTSGEYHSWKRTPKLQIETKDPYAAHVELLNRITDDQIHDTVAYLESLK